MTPVPIDSEWSLFTKLGNHARSLVSREPYVFYEYGGSRFSGQLQDAVDRAAPDLLHLDSMDLYRWLPSLPAVKTSCTHRQHNTELLSLRARRIPNRAARAYIMHQANLMEKVERRLCARFDVNIMTSETDAERLRALAPGSRTSVAPNGVNVDYFQPTPLHQVVPGRVTFLGPTYMFPNRDAVQFFLADAWDLVRARCPEHLAFHRQELPRGQGSVPKFPAGSRESGVCSGYPATLRRSGLCRRAHSRRRRNEAKNPRCVGDGKSGGVDLDWMRGSENRRWA